MAAEYFFFSSVFSLLYSFFAFFFRVVKVCERIGLAAQFAAQRALLPARDTFAERLAAAL